MITIVSGLPRSGTSMMMQMLEVGGFTILNDGIRQADDSNTKGYYEYEPVKGLLKDQSWLPEAEGKVVKIVSVFLPHLPPDLEYQIIFMQRNLDAILQSQAKLLAKLGKGAPAANPTVLKKVFSDQNDKALKWAQAQDKAQLLNIDYEGTLAEPLESAKELVAFLGQGDAAAMAAAVEPSLRTVKS